MRATIRTRVQFSPHISRALTRFLSYNPSMDREEALKLLKGGPEGIAEWNKRRAAGEEIPSLLNVDLRAQQLDSANLEGANLGRAVLEAASLRKVILRAARLREARLQNAHLDDACLEGAHLRRAKLQGARLSRASLLGADLQLADLSAARLYNVKADDVTLTHATLVSAELPGASLERSDLRGADLRGAVFSEADLTDADLMEISVNNQTRFERANVTRCTIDRHALECLKDYGGLEKGDRMVMRIIDGVAVLRASYSGFLQWIHLAALLTFLFPYVAFVLRRWFDAKFTWSSDVTTIALWNALCRFIWNGGENWQAGWDLASWPFTWFCISLVYNLLRGTMMWKTKKLELVQQASGLPAIFSLAMKGGVLQRLRQWGFWYNVTRWGFYVNLLVVVAHTLHFLGQRIPLEGAA